MTANIILSNKGYSILAYQELAEKMRVLIVYHAGAMQPARRIYNELAQTGSVELTVVVPQKLRVENIYDPDGWLRVGREENGDGYHLIPVPLRNPSNYGRGFEIRSLQSAINRIKPDIIHVFDEGYSNYLFQVIWQSRIASPRSRVLFYAFSNRPLRLGWRSGLWKFAWSRTAGGVTANTEAIEHLRRAGFPKNLPLERIFWGISTDVFKPIGGSVVKRELGLGCERTIGFVGNLLPLKGLGVLQAAMGRLPKDVHCVIIGDGPMRQELEAWSNLPDFKGRVHLCGAVPQGTLVKYVNCMDVLALPSLTAPHFKEQYGRVIAEAMACGVPVVGSDSGAIPEVIGSGGLVVPEGDPVALAEAAYRIIFDMEFRAGLRQECLRRAEQELSIKAMVRRLLDFYSRILKG